MNPTESEPNSQELSTPLLVRHRWLGNPIRRRYICTPGIPSLYESPDPICFGCGAEMAWKAIPNLRKFCGVSDDRVLAEDLGIRLDLRYCELRLERRWS